MTLWANDIGNTGWGLSSEGPLTEGPQRGGRSGERRQSRGKLRADRMRMRAGANLPAENDSLHHHAGSPARAPADVHAHAHVEASARNEDASTQAAVPRAQQPISPALPATRQTTSSRCAEHIIARPTAASSSSRADRRQTLASGMPMAAATVKPESLGARSPGQGVLGAVWSRLSRGRRARRDVQTTEPGFRRRARVNSPASTRDVASALQLAQLAQHAEQEPGDPGDADELQSSDDPDQRAINLLRELSAEQTE